MCYYYFIASFCFINRANEHVSEFLAHYGTSFKNRPSFSTGISHWNFHPPSDNTLQAVFRRNAMQTEDEVSWRVCQRLQLWRLLLCLLLGGSQADQSRSPIQRLRGQARPGTPGIHLPPAQLGREDGCWGEDEAEGSRQDARGSPRAEMQRGTPHSGRLISQEALLLCFQHGTYKLLEENPDFARAMIH